MSVNGLYAINFRTPLGQGDGVVYLTDGKVKGGDSALWYDGSYTLEGVNFMGSIRTGQHAQGFSVLGNPNATLHFTGVFDGGTAKLTGTSKEAPGVTLTCHLRKVA